MAMLILKLLAGVVAAIIATRLVMIKTGSDAVSPRHVGKWRFTTEGVLSLSALWVALVFSTGTDVLKYQGDQKTAKDQEDKRLALVESANQIKALSTKANTGIDAANEQLHTSATALAGVAGTATETLGSVNTANDRLKATSGTLSGVVQRQVQATATANTTLGRLTDTATLVRRSSKPLRPLEFALHIKYEYGSTSKELQDYVDKVRTYVDKVEADDKANSEAGRSPVKRENWESNPRKIDITGFGPLLKLGSRRAQLVLTLGTVGITIRPTEVEGNTVTKDEVAMIGYADFTRNRPTFLNRNFVIVPPPSNLQIQIDRKTGEITEIFLLKKIDPIGAVFGINSLYDLPSKWVELVLPAPTDQLDNPKVAFFSFQNDTFITNGQFPESIILDTERFQGPTNLPPGTQSPVGPGVAFRYPLRDDDLDSAARFENDRRH